MRVIGGRFDGGGAVTVGVFVGFTSRGVSKCQVVILQRSVMDVQKASLWSWDTVGCTF